MAAGSTLDEEARDSAESPLEIGQVVAGKYRIERQIGRGGMGVVLAATHLQLETLVAIKVMRRDLLEDDKALNRLLTEARSAAKIRSEHVARVLDVGTLETGAPFIVMEYLEGEDLADLLDRQGALEVEQAVSFLLQCCEALAEVHMSEMVHRDLKPGNLFIAQLPDGSPTVKIVDFGISKQIGGAAREHGTTTAPQVLGSPFYMAPEQMRAEAVDERSDIWALGAILFEMLTGRPPFVAETLPEVYAAVLHSAAPPIDQLRSEVPAGLDDVVQRCLDKDPAQRFCDVADLAEALAPFGGAHSASSVDRITRILTNPEPLRHRPSMAPAPEPLHGAAKSIEERPPAVAPSSSPALQVPGAAPAPQPGPGARGLRDSVAAAVSGPVSASGLELEPHLLRPRRVRATIVGLAAVTAVVAAILWLSALAPERSGRSAETAAGSGPAVPQRAGAVPGPAEETKVEDAELAGNSKAAAAAPTAPASMRVERHALRASSRTKRRPKSSISVERFRSAVSGMKKKDATSGADSSTPLKRSAGAAKPAPQQQASVPAVVEQPVADEDPWNPDSFGDRR